MDNEEIGPTHLYVFYMYLYGRNKFIKYDREKFLIFKFMILLSFLLKYY